MAMLFRGERGKSGYCNRSPLLSPYVKPIAPATLWSGKLMSLIHITLSLALITCDVPGPDPLDGRTFSSACWNKIGMRCGTLPRFSWRRADSFEWFWCKAVGLGVCCVARLLGHWLERSRVKLENASPVLAHSWEVGQGQRQGLLGDQRGESPEAAGGLPGLWERPGTPSRSGDPCPVRVLLSGVDRSGAVIWAQECEDCTEVEVA